MFRVNRCNSREQSGRHHRRLALAAGVALSTLLLAVAEKPAAAAPSGLTQLPSTDIYKAKCIHLDVDTMGRNMNLDQQVSFGLTFGLGPDKPGLFGSTEVGFDDLLVVGRASLKGVGAGVPPELNALFNTANYTGTKRLLFNIKTQLYSNDAAGIRVVGGFWNVGEKVPTSQSITTQNGKLITLGSNQRGNIGYILASKVFPWGRIHAGYAHSFASDGELGFLSFGEKGSPSYSRDFAQFAFERFLAPKLQFVIDHYTGQSLFSRTSASLIFIADDRSDIQLGILHQNKSDISPRTLIYLGYDYNWYRDKKHKANPDSETEGEPRG